MDGLFLQSVNSSGIIRQSWDKKLQQASNKDKCELISTLNGTRLKETMGAKHAVELHGRNLLVEIFGGGDRTENVRGRRPNIFPHTM